MELVSQMCWVPIRMNVKGLKHANLLMFHENLNPESKHVGSRIQNLCLRHRCTHTQKGSQISTPPPALVQILSRPAFHLPCIVKDPVMTLPLWRLLLKRTQGACSQTLGGDPGKSGSWRWILITASCSRLTLFCHFTKDSSLCLTQLLHHLVK